MSKFSFFKNWLVGLVILTSLSLASTAVASTKITILQTSDLHGRIFPHDYALDSNDMDAGLAKIQTIVARERAANPNLILMDCGDTVQDNSAELFNDLPVHPMVNAMNLMGYDVWSIGNHEFNFELSFLKRNIQAFNGSVLSANIYKKGTNERWVKPYRIFTRDGVRVAVIGMIPPAVPIWESAAPQHFEGLEFTGPASETRKVIQELKGKYDILVGAYHIGPDGDHGFKGLEDIAKQFPQFDVLFAGHAHAKYKKEVNGVKIIEPGKYGWAVAKAEIEVARHGDTYQVVSVETTNIETKKLNADQNVLNMFKFVHDQSVSNANMVIGRISADFVKDVDYITGSAKVTTMPTSQLKDTAIIDLINDVQMHYTGADVSSAALFNFGSNLRAGDFKNKDVAYIYKYPNTLIGVRITGANLKKYMEWSASYYNTFNPGDLTISFNQKIRGYNYDMFSGLTYNIDLSKNAGNRVVDMKIDGRDLDPNKIYKLAVNNYRFGTIMKLGLVTADDKYYDSIARYPDVPDGRIRDLIIKYTKENKNGTLAPSVDNNWKLVGYSIDSALQAKAFALIKSGAITVPKSADGRTLNVRSITVNDLTSN